MDGAGTDEKRAEASARWRAEEREPQPPGQRSSALVEEAARVAATLNDKLPSLSDDSAVNHKAAPEAEREPQARGEARRADALSDAHAPQTFEREDESEESPAGGAAAAAAAAAQSEARGRIRQRAANVGASVGENLRPRVEKLREASTVVFDEATDDPGLRFVIVAAVLFLLFLFIFLLNYILG